MISRAPGPPARRHVGFTLIEVLIVVLVLAIFASMVVPGLANAQAPIPRPLADLIELDLRRAAIESVGSVRETVLVLGKERDRWWIQPGGNIDASLALPASQRVLGTGNLAPFAGHRLDLVIDGARLPGGDVVAAVFDQRGTRDRATIALTLLNAADGTQLARWTLESQRTKLKDHAVDTATPKP
jgi:prepilin-type N-terminal cleavage/methylation domain-containing protein